MNRPELIAVQKKLIDKLNEQIDSGIATPNRSALCMDIKTIGEAIAVAGYPPDAPAGSNG